MQDRIIGTTMPVLEITLDPGEAIFSESGELSWMTHKINRVFYRLPACLQRPSELTITGNIQGMERVYPCGYS